MKKTNQLSYNDPAAARAYIEYAESADGKAERQAIAQAIFPHLPLDKNTGILDAACGTGWLTKLLAEKYTKVEGCDSSLPLLEYARRKYPGCVFKEADMAKDLSRLPLQLYDVAIFSLATHDIKDLKNVFKQLARSLKPQGKLIITLTNPYYSFPVGVWKRGLWGKIFGGKTSLRLRSYNKLARSSREFSWRKNIASYFHTLPEILNGAMDAGFQLKKMEEIREDNPSPNSRQRQLFLFPMILLLVFQKS